MPLFNITWGAGQPKEVKEKIRMDISKKMGLLAGIDPSFIAVLFTDLSGNNMSNHGSFTEVYISEGRPDVFKDGITTLVTDTICEHTGWDNSKVIVMIHDIRKGSIAVNGKIVNRSGPAADAVIQERNS